MLECIDPKCLLQYDEGMAVNEEKQLWFKEAVIYQLHVKSFADSNGDGIGDFQGLIQKLDYLQDLGVTALWLLPFYPSPMKDDGYDIADYMAVHPQYGTLRDFQEFLDEAHSRGLKVVTELVLNHTSDQHEWFQKSRHAKPDSKWRNFYVWSDTPQRYSDARIIFKDFETSNWTWDSIAKAYYWHRFYSHQPDLNYDNPTVRKLMMRVVDFWLNMGVDGLRLDAVPYLYEREGTNCENLPETHAFLKEIRKHVDEKYENRMLLAEANQWPEDAVAYFGNANECQMAFHFPLMPRLFMALHMEDRYPIVEILEQTPKIPVACQWAIFLRNHDELTLEMVTDEERDYMYRVYAQDYRARINLGIRRRLAPLLSNNRRKIELLNMLLFSLPGTPIIYYGDEIGMGDNIYLGDRNGVRTPMQWSADKNAGFSRSNPQKLFLPIIIDPEYHYEAINAELQENNLSSLLWWTRRLIAMRKKFNAMSHGGIQFLMPENNKVLTFLREYEDEIILVVVNLSRFAQTIKLDLGRFAGWTPEEVFSYNRFETIRDVPYVMTLGAFDVFWFVLRQPKATTEGAPLSSPYTLRNKPDEDYWTSSQHEEFTSYALTAYLSRCFWLNERIIHIHNISIRECIPIKLNSSEDDSAYLLLLQISYEGRTEMISMPIGIANETTGKAFFENNPENIIARFESAEGWGVVFDATHDSRFRIALLELTISRRKLQGEHGKLVFRAWGDLFEARQKQLPQNSQLFATDRGSHWITYENQFSLKFYRRLMEGSNPEEESARYLYQQTFYQNIANVTGAIEYESNKDESISLGIFRTFIPHECDAWTLTLDALTRYYDRVLAKKATIPDLSNGVSLYAQPAAEFPSEVREILEGMYLNNARLLAQRTAEMHLALASETKNPDYAPEDFSLHYQRSTYQSMIETLHRTMRTLKQKIGDFPEAALSKAKECIQLETSIASIQKNMTREKIAATRTRIHGNYHLGNIIFTGKDFVVINFEGDIRRPFSERKIKRSPFRDITMLMRSFHFATFHSLMKSRSFRPDDIEFLMGYANLWFEYVSRTVLENYFQTAAGASFIPKNAEEKDILLKAFLMERMVSELALVLEYDPQWAIIPIRGLIHLIKTDFAFLKT
ncbi:MAG: maltose alpha-D-glucosyltransferase [Verrucomicrobiota bacterium]